MEKQADFVKKVELRKQKACINFNNLRKETVSKHCFESKRLHLKREDLEGFYVIGILDKKIIVAYHNDLQIFGYFDFHAIHERIRYEYYTAKLR